jgi:pyruvate/2-oxoglutarate dehydrogenase complex dihydrolipoamide dehydrogenase (E3) component
MDKTGVNIILKKEVTLQLVQQVHPDAVIVATGAIPRTLDVPGIASKNVVQAVDVIAGGVKVGERVVVIGGRLVGIETADFLAERGKKVAIITLHRLGENGRKLNDDIYRTLRNRLIDHGVSIFANSPVVEISELGIWANDNGNLLFLEADTVVLAVGAVPEIRLFAQLKGIVPELYAIGDCVEPRDALAAIREGAEVARKI